MFHFCSNQIERRYRLYMHTSYVQHKQLHMLEHLTSDWKQMAPWEKSPVYALETTPSISINRIMCKQASRSSLIEKLASYSLTLQRLPALAAEISPREMALSCQQGRGQPSSLAAALRKASVSPVARRLWASHSMHLCKSACQLMDAARHR